MMGIGLMALRVGPPIPPAWAGTRPTVPTAKAVLTRHAAIHCMVRLAGRRVGDRPRVHDRNSRSKQSVAHSHANQVINRAILPNQAATS